MCFIGAEVLQENVLVSIRISRKLHVGHVNRTVDGFRKRSRAAHHMYAQQFIRVHRMMADNAKRVPLPARDVGIVTYMRVFLEKGLNTVCIRVQFTLYLMRHWVYNEQMPNPRYLL